MAKDSEKTPATRLLQIRKEWGISKGGEATAKAQSEALVPLQKWLETGMKTPSVVIRSVQVLLADPEIPGVDQKQALSEVSQQIADAWATAGQDTQGVLGLQAMLLAAWPSAQAQGAFILAPLLASAFSTVKGRAPYQHRIDEWRNALLLPKAITTAETFSTPSHIQQLTALASTLAEEQSNLDKLAENAKADQTYTTVGPLLHGVLIKHHQFINKVSESLQALPSQFNTAWTQASRRLTVELELLWWGQSRYCHSLRKPYRRITNADERLWWMAWESSQLALNLAVEPASSFLVEMLHQLGDNISEKRPLKDWLRGLLSILSKADPRSEVCGPLAELASADALGMPVTWARLKASDSKRDEATLEKNARESTALDLDVEIDRGEWAAWVFRECLLDRHLGVK